MTYKRFTSNLKLSDVLHTNYYLLPIIHRFDIRFGIGDMTIGEVCARNDIDTDFFVEILNVYHDEYYFPEKTLRKLDIQLVVNYLTKTHQYYVDYLLPSIEEMVARFVKSGGANDKTLTPVAQLYNDYKAEFLKHIESEEINVFPHALRISALYNKSESLQQNDTWSAQSIRHFEDEHEAMDEKLFDLKNILIKYIEPPYNVHLRNTIIFELDRLERDVLDHARIEDRILFAAIEHMEKALKKRSESDRTIRERRGEE